MKCDQCCMTTINSVHLVHERGCPNEGKLWSPGKNAWVKVYECRECGSPYSDADDCARCCQPNEDEPQTRAADMILYLSDARGIYIPRDFARDTYRECITGVSQADLDILQAGPDEDLYWDVWDTVCNNATVTAKDSGKSYFLWQDGDLWLIESGAEYDEQNDQWIITE